jgi:uncharacterized glyoxalase superfamily protein PhnB
MAGKKAAKQTGKTKSAKPKPVVRKKAAVVRRKVAVGRKKAPAAGVAPRADRRKSDPATLRLRSVTAGFTVTDVARSVAWYRDVLGFVVADEWRVQGELRGAEMRAGAVALYLGQDDWKKGRDRVKGEGVRLYCTTRQDIDAVAERVKAAGGVLSHEPQTQPWGERDFGLMDPDGFKITVTTGA